MAQTPEALSLYGRYHPSSGEWLFPLMLWLTIAFFLGLGLYLKTIKPLLHPQIDEKKIQMMKTQFLIPDKKKPPPPVVRREEKIKPKPVDEPAPAPIDLTTQPVLNQKLDDIVHNPPAPGAAVARRRVYGLRRVYSTGIGAGGTMSDAVIGKIGNTLNKEVDTVTAKKQDLVGQLVSITSITSVPRMRNEVKAEYTKEMIENKIEGVIKAKLLIDSDGTVKEVIVLNDLGFGSREAAEKAFKKLVFEPAKRGTEAVAVWIISSYRFVLQTE